MTRGVELTVHYAKAALPNDWPGAANWGVLVKLKNSARNSTRDLLGSCDVTRVTFYRQYVPRARRYVQTIGTPLTAKTGALTRVLPIPPKNVPPEISPNWLVE